MKYYLKYGILIILFSFSNFHLYAQEIGIDAGVNKIGYTPFYRTFSEEYHLSFQTDFAWTMTERKPHRLLLGVMVQINLQQVIGNQLNIGPIIRYQIDMGNNVYTEVQAGYGLQMLFPKRSLYEQDASGGWERSGQLLVNHLLPLKVGIGKRFENHAVQINYGYQLIFGFNESVSTIPVERWALGYRFSFNKKE